MSVRYACLGLAASLLLPAAVFAQVTAIKAGRLIDPESGTSTANQTILVEGSRITAVGPDVAIPDNAEVLDLSDRAVMPGFFDCHAHMGAWLIKPQRAIYTTWIHSTPYRVLRGTVFAREMLEAGFTTIRNLSESGYYGDTAMAQAIEDGFVVGPTMLPAGRFLIPFGAEAPPNPERPDLNAPDKVEVDTRDEMKKEIRKNIHYGARVIKVLVDDTPYIYTAEDLEFMVEEAGRAGVPVAAHAVTDRGARNAAEAGVASIEHGTRISAETLELVKKNNVFIVPTPFTPFLIRQMGIRLSGMKNEDEWKDAERVHARYVAALKQNYQAGARLAFGSDVGVLAEGETRGTLAISTVDGYVAAGVPPIDILRALTVNAAELNRVEKERGRIAPGLAADIVATPDDPLENVDTVKNVVFVMKEGKVYRHDR